MRRINQKAGSDNRPRSWPFPWRSLTPLADLASPFHARPPSDINTLCYLRAEQNYGIKKVEQAGAIGAAKQG